MRTTIQVANIIDYKNVIETKNKCKILMRIIFITNIQMCELIL